MNVGFGSSQSSPRQLRRNDRQPDAVELDGLELADTPSPLEETIEREAGEACERALERLTPEEREAIIVRIELGCSYEELAQALSKPTPETPTPGGEALVRLAQEMAGERE